MEPKKVTKWFKKCGIVFMLEKAGVNVDMIRTMTELEYILAVALYMAFNAFVCYKEGIFKPDYEYKAIAWFFMHLWSPFAAVIHIFESFFMWPWSPNVKRSYPERDFTQWSDDKILDLIAKSKRELDKRHKA